MKKYFTLILATFVLAGYAQAQSTLKGKVSDEKGEALIGVSVYIKGTSIGTSTDVDGAYQLNVLAGSETGTLIFSLVGFTTQEVSIANRTEISVTLLEDTKLLSEVVITGYTAQEKVKITGAVSTVSAEALNKVPVPTIDQALQGRAPGVVVSQNTGAPGEGVSVRIRGVGSIGSGNGPLYIVDGIPTQDISTISMQDVEELSILKDASIAAQYGARATNGIVIIKTKAGKAGATRIQFDTQIGFQQPSRLIKMANSKQYNSIYNEAANNDNADVTNPLFLRPLITEAMAETFADVDQVDAILQNGILQTHTLSLSGGNEKTHYFISGNYFGQEGIIKSSNYTRITGRANVDSQIKDWLKVGVNMNVSRSTNNRVGSSGDGAGGNGGSVVRYAFFRTPGIPIRDENGEFVDLPDFPVQQGDGYNAVGMLAYNQNEINQDRVFGKFFFEANLAKNLKLTSNLGVDVNNADARRFDRTWGTNDRINNINRLAIGASRVQTLTFSNFLTYTHKTGEHTLSYLLGIETIKTDRHYFTASQSDFPDQRRKLVALGLGEGLTTTSEANSGSALASFFAKADYDYKNGKYIASATLRRDGSSRFGPDNRWGTFYAGSLGWRIDQEGFLVDNEFIDQLKLRVGYGVIGNQEIGDYQYLDAIQPGYDYGFGDTRYIGFAVSRLGNTKLKWESSNQFNAGLDFGFLNGSLTGSLDFYNKITSDLLVARPLPRSAGTASPSVVNDGKILNRGLELALTYNNKIGDDFTYSVSVNGATLHNEVLELNLPLPIRQGKVGSDYLTSTEVGHEVGSFYLYEMIGIFQSASEVFTSALPVTGVKPGDVKYKDQDIDGDIDGDDRKHVGSAIPKFTAGLTINLAYKGFDLSVFFQGAYGQKIFSVLNRDLEGFYRGFNVTERYYENHWTGPGTSNKYPRASWSASSNNTIVYSTRFLENGSYTRLKNIQLGYTFSKDLLDNYSINGLRIYVSATNLLTFTKYQGLDPEMTASDNTQGASGDMANGIDWGTYPAAKSFNVGLSLTF
jgi:TonB-dependent starch-binding outer membrane protein SusC